MDISSSGNTDMNAIQVDILQKSIDVNQREALKIMQNAVEDSKQVSAQKTRIGTRLNISG